MESKLTILFVFLQYFAKLSLSSTQHQKPNDDHTDKAWSKTDYQVINKTKVIERSLTLDCGKGWWNPKMSNTTFYWTKNGSSNLTRHLHDTPVKLLENKSKLVLKGLIKTDDAIYRCTGRYGNITTRKEFNVNVLLHGVSSRPYMYWTNEVADSKGKLGESHTFRCLVYSAETVVWKRLNENDPTGKNYTAITEDSRHHVTGHQIESDEKGIFRDEAKREYTMTIHNVIMEDEGIYQCAGINYIGTTYVKINFTVFESPPTKDPMHNLPKQSNSSYFWMGAILGVLLIIIMLNAGLWKRAKSNQQSLYPIRNTDCIPQMERVDEPNIVHDLDLWQATTGFYGQNVVQDDQLPYDSHWEIKRNEIQLEKILDEGFFGQVYRAKVTQKVQYANDVDQDTMYSKVR